MTKRIEDLRRMRRAARDARAAAIGRRGQAEAALTGGKERRLDTDSLQEIEHGLETAQSEVTRLDVVERRALEEIDREISAAGTSPVAQIRSLDAGFPVTLFPIRLETRFSREPPPKPGSVGELLVRIYPDGVASDSHEPLLTANEVAAGEAYWRRTFDRTPESKAWTALLTEALPERAAWIVEQTKPADADKPAGRRAKKPSFPHIDPRPNGWSREPEAAVLPERWIVSAFRDSIRVHQVFSAPVREGLALTLAGARLTKANAVDLSGDGLAVHRSLSWAYDFDEAVKAGMAVRIPLAADDLNEGFSTLLVLGVRAATAASAQSGEIERLFDSHRYSRGMAFVPQGAKTNNTEEKPADYPPADAEGATSFATARGMPLAGQNTDGARFARTLGIRASAMDHVFGAGRDEQKSPAAMVDALWPATAGYFIDQMLPELIGAGLAESIRQHARRYVRGRGHFPAFRVGGVPYGVLPVGALSRWTYGEVSGKEDLDTLLPQAFARLRPAWTSAAASLPRIGRSSDPDDDLVEILAQDASAQTVQIRRSFGQDTIRNVSSSTGLDFSAGERTRAGIIGKLLRAIGQPKWDARLLRMTLADEAHDFAGPLVDDNPLSESGPLGVNYIAWLRSASLTDLKEQQVAAVGKTSNTLLYLMLRHGLLAAYHEAAKSLLGDADRLDPEMAIERELIGIATPTKPSGATAERRAVADHETAWARLEGKLEDVTGDQSIGEFLSDEKNLSRPLPAAVTRALKRFHQHRSSLATLERLPTAELERLFTETLDVCSHRLDAWITSLYAKRLDEMRAREPIGSYSACYGWVEDLKADAMEDRTTVKTPRGTEPAAAGSGSFIQAPSMLHGATAAVLRSAHLSRANAGGQSYAVNLSSRRTRTALAVLDSVREGLPLGAVLGYQFERGLHDKHPGRELDRFIEAFRARYPLVANKSEESGESAESVAARNVVDGLRLHEAWLSGAVPWGEGGLDPNPVERSALEVELQRLADTVDAGGDLLLAESVFQILKGSTAGAAATLDSLAKGKHSSEPEVVATPRGGAVIHQRVALICPQVAIPVAWGELAISPRAAAAPELNAWLAELLGSPDQIACTVHRQNAGSVTVTVADLGLHPLDLLALVDHADASLQQARELDFRVGWQIAGVTGSSDAALSIDYAEAPPGQISLSEAMELLSVAGRLLGAGRPLEPRDLLPPELASSLAGADLMPDDLAGRAETASTALTALIEELEAAVDALVAAAPGSEPGLTALREALIGAAAFCVDGAFPSTRHGNGGVERANLIASARSTLAKLGRRQQNAALGDGPKSVLAAVFGNGFPVLPRFKPAAPDLLRPTIATEPDLGEDPDRAVESWFAGLARVREPLGLLQQVQLYARALGRASPRLRIAQIPLGEGIPRWVGLDFKPPSVHPRAGLVSLAVIGGVPAAEDPWSGVLVDSWPEILPNAEEETGVVFQYDAPGTEAPQCVLIAVPPAGEKNWSYELLEETLLDTLELAKIRAVDIAALGSLGQLFPMTFLAANAANATIATSFAGLLRDKATIVPGGAP